MPAEWSPHAAVWIGYPWDPAEWPVALAWAQRDVIAFARAVHDDGAGEDVRLIATNEAIARHIVQLAGDALPLPLIHPIGDIWLRDTGPIIVRDAAGRLAARDFAFNGWGGKFDMPGDREIAGRLAATEHLPIRATSYVLEGGAVDVDGAGLAVTTEQCLLNVNRNPGWTRADYAAALRADLGVDDILWLGNGLAGDHTDGHVDNLARFVAPGRLAVPEVSDDDDPNHAVYADAEARAAAFGVDVVRLPSPGRVILNGDVAAASYMNFYIGNRVVVVPTYGVANDDAAVAAIGALFPDRRVVGVAATGILHGGGSFHCASQQLPVGTPA